MPAPPFQALTVKAQGIIDRVFTDIRVAAAFDPSAPPQPPPKLVSTKALWDTGATKSVITARVAQDLGLTPVGQVTVYHAGGSGASPTYLVNLILPNKVLIAGALVSELAQASEFDVIVGMDVICHGDFAITNVGGRTSMSFRTPSCVAIDYVEEHNRLMFSGTGRNDPCPCGSATKFKKCHGR